MALTDTWLRKNLGKERSAVHTEADQEGLGARISQKVRLHFNSVFVITENKLVWIWGLIH
jgi:hypothetical protein